MTRGVNNREAPGDIDKHLIQTLHLRGGGGHMLYMKRLFVIGSLLDHLWHKIIPHLSVVSRLLAL